MVCIPDNTPTDPTRMIVGLKMDFEVAVGLSAVLHKVGRRLADIGLTDESTALRALALGLAEAASGALAASITGEDLKGEVPVDLDALDDLDEPTEPA